MQYCQKNQIKFTEGKMLDINGNEISLNNGQMVIYNISFMNQESADKIKNEYPKNQLKVEIDVLTLPKGINNQETICIVGDSVNGHLECEIHNASLKTMLAHIFSLLQERWKITGMDAVLVLRDKNLEREFNYLAQQLDIECRLENKLPSIDAKYISTSKRNSIENMDPKTLVLRLLEELGIDISDIVKNGKVKQRYQRKIITSSFIDLRRMIFKTNHLPKADFILRSRISPLRSKDFT